MKQELIQSFVVWCEETAAKLELDLLTEDDGIVESAWCEETDKRVNVIRPAMNIRDRVPPPAEGNRPVDAAFA